jgi:hypothetical protein
LTGFTDSCFFIVSSVPAPPNISHSAFIPRPYQSSFDDVFSEYVCVCVCVSVAAVVTILSTKRNLFSNKYIYVCIFIFA